MIIALSRLASDLIDSEISQMKASVVSVIALIIILGLAKVFTAVRSAPKVKDESEL